MQPSDPSALNPSRNLTQGRLYALYETDPSPVVAFLEFLAGSYGLSGSLRVLDVGCGPGRLLGPLTRLGWRVTGLEPDPDYANTAARVSDSLAGAEVREGGFGDLADYRAYDLIAAVNGPFSYLLTAESRRDAIERCAAALRPGGVLFLHFSNFWWILRHYQEPTPKKMEIGSIAVTRTAVHEIDYHAGRFTHTDTFRWTDEGGERELGKTHEMAMFGPGEVMGLLADAGLTDVRTFNGYEDREASRLHGKRVMIAARA